MNDVEWQKWEDDARAALKGRYAKDDITIIIHWFRSIKWAGECNLIGDAAVEAFDLVVSAVRDRHADPRLFDLYNSLMARLFLYAPLILQQSKQRQVEDHEALIRNVVNKVVAANSLLVAGHKYGFHEIWNVLVAACVQEAGCPLDPKCLREVLNSALS